MTWEQGYKNTKTFEVNDTYVRFVQGCRTCNGITLYKDAFKERQRIGNCYQSLCRCAKCNNPLVLDEHRISDRKLFINQFKS